MSAGSFQNSKYQLPNGEIAVVRVQPETLAATFSPGGTNAAPTGAATLPGTYPLNRGGRRRRPFSTRYARVRFTETPPDGYAAGSVLTIPILTNAVFGNITEQSTGTYLGTAIEVLSKVGHAGAGAT